MTMFIPDYNKASGPQKKASNSTFCTLFRLAPLDVEMQKKKSDKLAK